MAKHPCRKIAADFTGELLQRKGQKALSDARLKPGSA
jgi:hypothetical protein